LLINKHKTLAKNHRIEKNSEHKSKYNRSQATLNQLKLTENLVNNLQLKRYLHETKLSGIGTTVESRLNFFEAVVECITRQRFESDAKGVLENRKDTCLNEIPVVYP